MAVAVDAKLSSGYRHFSFPEGRGARCGVVRLYRVRGGGMWLRGWRPEPGDQAGFNRGRTLGLVGKSRGAEEKASSWVGWTGEG